MLYGCRIWFTSLTGKHPSRSIRWHLPLYSSCRGSLIIIFFVEKACIVLTAIFSIILLRSFRRGRNETKLGIWRRLSFLCAGITSLHTRLTVCTTAKYWCLWSWWRRIIRLTDYTVCLSKTWLRLIVGHGSMSLRHYSSLPSYWVLVTNTRTWIWIIGGTSTHWGAQTTWWLVNVVVWGRSWHNWACLIWIKWPTWCWHSNWSLRHEALLGHQIGLVAWSNWMCLTTWWSVWNMTLFLRLSRGSRRHSWLNRVWVTRVTISIHMVVWLVTILLNLARPWGHSLCLMIACRDVVSIWSTKALSNLMRIVVMTSHHFFCLFHLLVGVIYFLTLPLSCFILLTWRVLF